MLAKNNFLGVQTVKRLVDQVECPVMFREFLNYMCSIDHVPRETYPHHLMAGFVTPHKLKSSNDDLPNLFGIYCPALPLEDNLVSLRGRQLTPDRECPEWFKQAIQDEAMDIAFRVKVTFQLKSGTRAFVKPCARDLEHAKVEYKRYLNEQVTKEKDLQTKAEAEDNPAQQRVAFAEMAYRHFAKKNNGVLIGFDPRTYTALMLCRAGAKGGHFVNVLTGAEDIYLFSEGIKKGNTTLDEETQRAVHVIYLG